MKDKDRDVDTHLRQQLSGSLPREAFKQQTLRDSTAALLRVRRRRSARRRAEFAAAAILIVGIGFLGGRLSVSRTLPRSVDLAPGATAEPDEVTVPSDMVAWLDAARLFMQLGMEDRMARAVEHAGQLLPHDVMASSSMTGKTLANNSVEDVFENQHKHSILAEILGPHESVENTSGILAHSFGGHYYESKMD